MNILNPFANSVLNPGVARTASLRVDGEDPITAAQLALTQNAYARFKQQTQYSPAGLLTRDLVLPDGTTVAITSRNGVDQVVVNPAPVLAPNDQPMGVWIMVQLAEQTKTVLDSSQPGGGRTDYRYDGKLRSLLYRVPKSMKLESAKLIYTGETQYTYTTLEALAPPDINGPVSTYTASIHGTLSETEGEIGYACGFVPYRGKATLVALRSTQTVTSSSRYDGEQSTTRTGTLWDGDSIIKTYTANYDIIGAGPAASPHVVSSTRSGEIIACVPRSVANGQVNYKVRQLAGNYGIGTGDPTRFEKFVANEGASIDPDGIEKVDLTGNPPGGFTRRQVGYMDQTPKTILTKSVATAFQIRTRANVARRTLPAAGSYQWPAFYNDALYMRMSSTNPAQRSIDLLTFANKKVLTLNIRSLPGLHTDSMFAAADARISAAAGSVAIGSNVFIDEIGWGDFAPNSLIQGGDYLQTGEGPRRYSWGISNSDFQATFGALNNSSSSIQVTLIPDQADYNWPDET